MNYPNVLGEYETITAAQGLSLSRYGDGELRTCLGGDAISQRERSPKLMAELRAILQEPTPNLLVCIPNIYSKTPKAASWKKYGDPKYVALYGKQQFGSSLVTRPDSAPWIDTPEYWDKVRSLWKGKDIVLAVGDKKSVTSEMIEGEAASYREVWGPRVNAYAEIDRMEEEIGLHTGTVITCLGVTATVLAARLAKKGVHCLDLGHIGMFMRHAGAYRFTTPDLITKNYREQIAELHASKRWGGDGKKQAETVKAFWDVLEKEGARTILDYGCGLETLAKCLKPLRVSGYDPGIPGKEGMPKPCDLVICTDVLEHIEPDRLDNVLTHIYTLTGKGAYIVVATRPAKNILPDGRNAHLIIESPIWWMEKLLNKGFQIERYEVKEGHAVKLWLRK
jgi:hypothetical protein